jgi:hypothetical protein
MEANGITFKRLLMLLNDSLYNQYATLLQELNNLQTEYDLLVKQKISPLVIQSLKAQMEMTRENLQNVINQLVYINPFSGERETSGGHELIFCD